MRFRFNHAAGYWEFLVYETKPGLVEPLGIDWWEQIRGPAQVQFDRETLLRPAHAAPSVTPPAQLLRYSAANE